MNANNYTEDLFKRFSRMGVDNDDQIIILLVGACQLMMKDCRMGVDFPLKTQDGVFKVVLKIERQTD